MDRSAEKAMATRLFPRNQRAYEAVERLLRETGRATVVHPTGTGKSFIAFHLAEEHPQAHFLWLSPGRYIFRTQQEVYACAAGVPAPKYVISLYSWREALGCAAGPDVIFRRHMTDPHGKYLVF